MITITLLGTGSPMPSPDRAGPATLVLTHYVPPIPTGTGGADWKALAAPHFAGAIEIGDDLHQITITGS